MKIYGFLIFLTLKWTIALNYTPNHQKNQNICLFVVDNNWTCEIIGEIERLFGTKRKKKIVYRRYWSVFQQIIRFINCEWSCVPIKVKSLCENNRKSETKERIESFEKVTCC